MLVEISKEAYRKCFTTDPNLFITEPFISLVESKCDKIVRLMKEDDSSMGIILGITGNIAKSPFSAPFGGFHYSHEHLFYHVIHDFLKDIKEFTARAGLQQICITLPPCLYQANMNAKLVNAFVALGFTSAVPEITQWADLKNFNGKWVKPVVEQNCRKAAKHGLTWSIATDRKSQEDAYNVICRNREEQNRKIYMTLDDLFDVNEIMPVDFCIVREPNGECISAGVFYRGMDKIVTGIFLGDNLEKRNLGSMNYLYKQCYIHYKEMGFDYIDLGTSSLEGEANEGLIRFKELHNCITSLRYSFSWKP